MQLADDFRIRDPFVLVDSKENCYYLYGTTMPFLGYPELGFYCWKSKDLIHWEGPVPAFLPGKDFWATDEFWAPEVYQYKDQFVMFATFRSETRCRGTQILSAARSEGPFQPLTEFPVTPENWSCLDGTLWIEDGTPWIVFCHEWIQIGVGTIEAMPLTDDLKSPAGPPVTLFRGNDASWARPVRGEAFVTDGPFLYRENGKLKMLWSGFGKDGYAMGIAESETGKITGPWIQNANPVFSRDGGHGMIFQSGEHGTVITVHQPNQDSEHAKFFKYENGTIMSAIN